MKAFITLPAGHTFSTFFTPENIRLAESLGQITWNRSTKNLSADQVAELIGDCEVYISAWGAPRLDQTILSAAPSLRLLTHLCGTVAPFVSDMMWERGIRVISGNAYFAESVAEGTVGYILAALRDIPYYSNNLKNNKKWKISTYSNSGLLGKKVGLVSYGAIAKNLVRMLAPFRVKIMVYDIVNIPDEDKERYGIKQTSLEEIFATSDVISLHTPLYDATRKMIDKRLLSMIKEGALFVNTARGGIVDQSALCDQLSTGRFRAFLDVYTKEPPEADDPLYTLPNVMMMPHMAGPTTDIRQIITHDLLLESAGFIDHGQPLKNEIKRAAAGQMSER